MSLMAHSIALSYSALGRLGLGVGIFESLDVSISGGLVVGRVYTKKILFLVIFLFQSYETTVWVSLTVWLSGTYLSK